jgi:hypothetical protein
VTSIGSSAFSGCSGLTSVTIPNSVTTIGMSAFCDCSGLTSVTIPNSVESIGYSAFLGCIGLTSIMVEGGNKNYDSRNNCNAIIEKSSNSLIIGCKNTTIPNSVTSIGVSAFGGCSSLTSINIPNSVESIGYRAFYGCSGLTSVSIPNSVTSIGESAFKDCSGLKTIYSELETPIQITYIEHDKDTSIHDDYYFYPFSDDIFTNATLYVPKDTKSAYLATSGWNKFTNIFEVGEVGSLFEVDGIYYKIGENNTVSVISGKSEYSGDIVIPSQVSYLGTTYSVTSIGDDAFFGCCGLTSITIPNSVTSIGQRAFSHCEGLTSITIPNSVRSIGFEAFALSSLTSITSEIEDPFSIGLSTFDDIGPNPQLIVPKGKKSAYQSTEGWNQFTNIVEVGGVGYKFDVNGIYYRIGENNTVSVISGRKKYSGEVVIPSHITYGGTTYSVTSIGAYTFDGGSDITYLSIPYSIKSIGEYAFRGCGSSMTVNIADLKSWCNMKLGNEHASPLSSAGKMLVNNVETTSLDIPETVTTINAFTFYQCSCITSLNIPGTVTSIKSSAFEDCDYLTSLTLNEGLQSIGGSAFEGCKSLSTLTIPGTVNTIKVNAFKNCSVLTSIISEIENPFEINNNVFNGIPSYAQLIVPKGKKSVYQATAGWNQFTNIVEVGGVGYKFEADGIYYKIGENNTVSVTYGDTKYSGDVVIPSQVVYEGKTYSVTSIGVMAFYECSELTSITIPNSVKSIDDEAFSYSGITSVIIPESVWGIGWRAFCGCGLTSITFLGSVWIDKEAFMNCGALNAVHISDLESFLKNEYEESYEESNPLEYAHHLYLNGVEIKDLVIPNTITEIRHHAFYECRSLTSVTIPNSVTSIDECAFGGCSGLTSVVIGNGVKHILYSYAFLNCENLKEMILSQAAYENGIPESVTKFTTYSKDPMRVVVTSKGATSATMKIYPIDDSGNTNVDKCYTVTMLGLTPEQYIKWKLDDENYGIISEKTSALTLTTQPAQPTSTTKARLTAMVNEADDDQHYGFEWLRNEAPSNMPPNKVSAPLYEGKIMGSLSGLNPDIYYKYRPFYQSDSGETYYGEWIAFLTGDANVFFEPETHTKEATDVTDVSAQLAGVWIEGTEDTEEKGFEYWTVSKVSTRAVGSDAKTVAVSGNQTTITIDNLEAGKEYGYRTYMKTASGMTYGEEKTFKTILMGDVNDDGDVNEADVDDVASHIMGHSPTGFNKEKADMNHDGEVNAVDLVEIVKIVNGKK